jgi:hypothetical protein
MAEVAAMVSMNTIPTVLNRVIDGFETRFRQPPYELDARRSPTVKAGTYVPIQLPSKSWQNALSVFVAGTRAGWVVVHVPPETIEGWEHRLERDGIGSSPDEKWSTRGKRQADSDYKLGFWIPPDNLDQHQGPMDDLVRDSVTFWRSEP